MTRRCETAYPHASPKAPWSSPSATPFRTPYRPDDAGTADLLIGVPVLGSSPLRPLPVVTYSVCLGTSSLSSTAPARCQSSCPVVAR